MDLPYRAGHGKGRAELASVVHRNIEALIQYQKERSEQRSLDQRIADRITGAIGTLAFAVVQIVFMVGWIAVNTILGASGWDHYPWSVLALICGGEAILLSAVVLVSQKRLAHLEERRSDLDLQISLLSEHEVTRAITLLEAISGKLGVDVGHRPSAASREITFGTEAA